MSGELVLGILAVIVIAAALVIVYFLMRKKHCVFDLGVPNLGTMSFMKGCEARYGALVQKIFGKNCQKTLGPILCDPKKMCQAADVSVNVRSDFVNMSDECCDSPPKSYTDVPKFLECAMQDAKGVGWLLDSNFKVCVGKPNTEVPDASTSKCEDACEIVPPVAGARVRVCGLGSDCRIESGDFYDKVQDMIKNDNGVCAVVDQLDVKDMSGMLQ